MVVIYNRVRILQQRPFEMHFFIQLQVCYSCSVYVTGGKKSIYKSLRGTNQYIVPFLIHGNNIIIILNAVSSFSAMFSNFIKTYGDRQNMAVETIRRYYAKISARPPLMSVSKKYECRKTSGTTP